MGLGNTIHFLVLLSVCLLAVKCQEEEEEAESLREMAYKIKANAIKNRAEVTVKEPSDGSICAYLGNNEDLKSFRKTMNQLNLIKFAMNDVCSQESEPLIFESLCQGLAGGTIASTRDFCHNFEVKPPRSFLNEDDIYCLKPITKKELFHESDALTDHKALVDRFVTETTMLEIGLFNYCSQAKEDAEKFCQNEELVKQYPEQAAKVC